MSNECSNHIEVYGDKGQIEQMFEFVCSEENRGFDFNKIAPYPIEYAKMDAECEDSGWLTGGHDWTMKQWGTRGNAMEPITGYPYNEDGTLSVIAGIFYNSLLSPALPVTEALSKLFPGLTFKHIYADSDLDYCGYTTYRNGEILEEKSGEFGEFPLFEH